GETEVVSDTNYRRILVVKDGTSTIVEAYISPVAGKYVDSETSQQSEQHGIFSGQVMTAVKDACRQVVLKKKPRLVEAMRARVLKEGMQEGSALFTVHAYLPVSESFGFAGMTLGNKNFWCWQFSFLPLASFGSCFLPTFLQK
ncbi:hypothetical protein CUMW_250220, partial [Citrus unshiu]